MRQRSPAATARRDCVTSSCRPCPIPSCRHLCRRPSFPLRASLPQRVRTCGRRFAFDGGFLGLGDGLRHDGRGDDGITGAPRDDRHAGRQLHTGHVQRMGGVELGQVDLDEFGKILRQARDVDLRHHVADDRAFALDGRRLRLVDEVQRHLHVDLARRIDPLEVDMQHLVAERMHLHVAQQDLGARSVDLHRQDRRMEHFVAQRMDQCVVVELDRLRRRGSAIDDSRRLAGAAHPARRAATFGCTGKCGEFDRGHVGDSFVGLRPPGIDTDRPQWSAPRTRARASREKPLIIAESRRSGLSHPCTCRCFGVPTASIGRR